MKRISYKLFPLCFALIISVYLIFDLIFLTHDFNSSHLVLFVLAAALVISPLATKIKIPNILEFETKLKNIDQDISQIKNTISTITDVRVNPRVNQFTILGNDLVSTDKLESILKNFNSENEISEDNNVQNDRLRFLQQTRAVINLTRMLFIMIRLLHLAYQEKRSFNIDSDGIDTLTPIDQAIFLSDFMLKDGLQYLQSLNYPDAITEGINTYRKLSAMYLDVHDNNTSPPDSNKTNDMVNTLSDMSSKLLAFIAIYYSSITASQQKLLEAIPYFNQGLMPPMDSKSDSSV